MKRFNHSCIAGSMFLAIAMLAGGAQAAPVQALSGAQLQAQGKVRVIVVFKAGKAAAARAAIAAAGGREVVSLDEVNAVAIELSSKAVAALQRSPHVDHIEADVARHAFAATARTGGASGVSVGSQVIPYGISMVQADQLPDSLASGRKLCIVDSGYEVAHEDLIGNQVDGVNLTTSGSWFTDEAHHGTHVGGTVSAINNTLGVVGVMPNKQIRLYIAKVFDASGSASSSVVAKGMLSCMKARANVVSMSLGGPASKIEETVVNLLAGRNMLIIAAAGNAGTSDVSYPAGYANVVSVAAIDSNKVVASFSQFNSDVELSGPGVGVLSTVPMGTGSDAALAVGSAAYTVLGMAGSPYLSATAALADFGFGDAVNPALAGKVCLISRGNIAFSDKVLNCQNSGGVGAVIYNNVAGALNGTLNGVVTTIPSVGASDTDGAAMLGQLGQTATVAVRTSNYAVFNGTSMATPHVSAVAALVWSYFPSCTASQIRDSLDKSALDLGAPGRDVNYGFGLVQAKAAYDRINSLGCGG